jgi:GntR family transcriptional regulator/MocR family aminotransferase
LSQRGQRLASFHGGERFEIQPIGSEDADFTLFPIKQWQRLQSRQLRLSRPDLLDYSSEGGFLPLRQAIADYVRVSRAVKVDVDQVLITAGTQHSLDLCVQLLTDAGDRVWVENPCYWGARAIFDARELRLDPVEVDTDGLDPATAPSGSHPRLIYLTPSNQYPTGVAMSLSRRRSVLDVATREQCWILEDDYDSELRYAGRPLASLQGLDVEQRVLYLGTFSKVLYPGIKIGYLILPPALVAPFRTALYDLQRPGQIPVQAALAEFIQRGYFTTHVRRLRQAYADARECLLRVLRPAVDAGAVVLSQNAGVHLAIELPRGHDDEALAQVIRQKGARVTALSRYYLGKHARKGLVIGYGYAPLPRVEYGGRIIATAVRAALQAR